MTRKTAPLPDLIWRKSNICCPKSLYAQLVLRINKDTCPERLKRINITCFLRGTSRSVLWTCYSDQLRALYKEQIVLYKVAKLDYKWSFLEWCEWTSRFANRLIETKLAALLSAVLHIAWISRINRITDASYLSSSVLIHVDCLWHGSSLGGTILCQLKHPSHQFLFRTITIFRVDWYCVVLTLVTLYQNRAVRSICDAWERWALNTTLWFENLKVIDFCRFVYVCGRIILKVS